jgi:hypothetical protein
MVMMIAGAHRMKTAKYWAEFPWKKILRLDFKKVVCIFKKLSGK